MSLTQPAFPESRICRHRACQQETEVRGQAYEKLSNPLIHVPHAWCDSCQSFLPVADFEWSDTGEAISDYRTRHQASATPLQRFLCSPRCIVVCALVGALMGATLGYSLFPDKAWIVRAFIAAFVGAVSTFIFVSLHDSFVNKLLMWRICGVVDARMLK